MQFPVDQSLLPAAPAQGGGGCPGPSAPGAGFWLQRGGLCRGGQGASFPRVSSSIHVPALGRHCLIEAVWQTAAAHGLLSKSCTLEINRRQLWQRGLGVTRLEFQSSLCLGCRELGVQCLSALEKGSGHGWIRGAQRSHGSTWCAG